MPPGGLTQRRWRRRRLGEVSGDVAGDIRMGRLLVEPPQAIQVGIEALAVLCQLLTQRLPGMTPQHPGLVIAHRRAIPVGVVDAAITVDIQPDGQRLALSQQRLQAPRGARAVGAAASPPGRTAPGVELLAIGQPGAGNARMAVHTPWPHAEARAPRAHRQPEAPLAQIEADTWREGDTALEAKSHGDLLVGRCRQRFILHSRGDLWEAHTAKTEESVI